jgi:hypothetical protein
MAKLHKWPEVEVLRNPLEPEADAIAPVEIRFQVKPEAGEGWSDDLAADCTVAGHSAPTPGAVLSFREWEKDASPTLYCYALARNLQEGTQVTLRVRPGEKTGRAEQATSLWEKDFRVRLEGDKVRLE